MRWIERLRLALRARLVIALVLLINVATCLAGLYILWLYDDYRRDFVEHEIPMARSISGVNTALAQVQIDLDGLIAQAGRRRIDESVVYREGQKLLDRLDLIRSPEQSDGARGDHIAPDIYRRFLGSITQYRAHVMASVTALTVNLARADEHARRASRASLEINQDAADLIWMLHEGMRRDSEALSDRLYRVGLPMALLVIVFTAAIFWLIHRLARNMTHTVESLQKTLGRLRAGEVDMDIAPADATQEARDIADSLGAFRQTLQALATIRADLARQVEERTRQLQDANREMNEQLQRLMRTEEKLRIFKQVFDSTSEAIVITDLHSRIVEVNNAYVDITGYGPEEVVGGTPKVLSSGRHDKAFYQAMWHGINTRGVWSGEIWDRRRDGREFPTRHTINVIYDEQEQPVNYVSVFSDITQLKQVQQELEQMAYFDRLTGLPNRRLLWDRIEHAVALAERSRSYGAVFFLDLDHFKHVNDRHGHQIGDLLLAEVAQRIKDCVRGADTVGRIAGDEFVVLAEDLSAQPEQASEQAIAIGQKIVAALSAAYAPGGRLVHCSASVGVALFGGGGKGDGVELLLSKADTAMYEAKKAGRANWCLFRPAMWQNLQDRVEMEIRLRDALREGRFFPLYQPVVDKRGRVVSLEALVRWDDGERGTVAPAEFIPLAEETQLIVDIEKSMLEQVCGQLAVWGREEALAALPVALNVSALHFNHPEFVDTVASALARHGVSPARLKLELTESVVMKDVKSSVSRMRALQAWGVRLAMDDFGTGHSSLAYLRELPFDQIKIDRSFIRQVQDAQSDRFIIQAVLAFANFMSVEVVAEGVENEPQREALLALGCQFFQGYLFSCPLSARECEAVVREGSMLRSRVGDSGA